MTPGRTASLVALLAVSFAAPLGSQVMSLPPAQARDAPPPRPTERRIPVGTSSISGTVVSADHGRPVRGARVSISGQVTLPEAAVAALRGGGPTVMSGSMPVNARGGMAMQMGGVVTSLTRTVATDDTGAFSFPRLPAGQFQLSVTHGNYLQLNYGQRRPGGMGKFLQLADGQQQTLKVALDRGAVISGTVIGPDGEPQRNAQVRGLRYVRTNGVKRLQTQGFASTDDRGVYRMHGLPPGEYLISVTPNPSEAINMERLMAQFDVIERAITSGQPTPPSAPGLPSTVVVSVPPPQQQPNQVPPAAYVPTFAPGASSPSNATPISVAAGEERLSVDVLVRHTIATTLQVDVSAPLEPGVQVQMQLTTDDPSAEGNESGMMRDQNGRVFFRGVRPGKYTVVAQTVAAPAPFVPGQQPQPAPQLTDAQKMWARVPVEVGGDPLQSVSLMLRPARSISGLVVFDTARPVDLTRSRVSVSLTPAPSTQVMYFGAQPQAQVGPDGRFTLSGVVPGRYIIRASGAGGFLRSAMSGGQDTLDFMLDFAGERDVSDVVLTMADTASELTGTLTDSAGKPAPDYAIVIAPSDNRYWVPGSRRVVMTRPGPDGRYSFRALPPGSYFLAAVIDPEQGVQYDPEFLRELASASVPVTIMEGAKSTQDIRVK